jgi:transglutaminase-like putative cysteine protease
MLGWVATIGVLVHRTYIQAAPATLATDLARYGPTAVWKGVYYRGEKIGFTVSQITRLDDGFELQEDGTLQMVLLGQDSAATIRTRARVDAEFALRSFEFSLDPGTGAVQVQGTIEASPAGRPPRLTMSMTSAGATRTETRDLEQVPVLAMNLPRQLANGRLTTGSRHTWHVLDPATARTAPMTVTVGSRAIARAAGTLVPAYRVEMEFQGLRTTSWITDTGDVVREESPLGLMTVQEPADRARGMAMDASVRSDLLQASAVVPSMSGRIDEPRDVRRLRLRLSGADVPRADLDGVGQSVQGDVIELHDPRTSRRTGGDPATPADRAAEALIESDAPEIRREAEYAVRGVTDDYTRALRLTRYVNALIEKKPTISLPSALEVLRTKVGDCNEHTALYVAMARSLGIPARVAVGLVYMRDAFYYHAWAEVYVHDAQGGVWLPADPTLDQFPADRTHLRLTRGGLAKQAAILPLVGRLRMTVVELELDPAAPRHVAGDDLVAALSPMAPAIDAGKSAAGCRCARANTSSPNAHTTQVQGAAPTR